jgi:DNA-binding transcriptional ArsR family regulator
MVDNSSEQLDRVFRALADPTRRALLKRLADGEQTISELAAPFDMSLEAVSKHVRVLERAGLLQRNIEGRTHVCKLDARPMHGGLEWIRHYEKYWNRRLDVLEELLENEDRAAGRPRKPGKRRSKR